VRTTATLLVIRPCAAANIEADFDFPGYLLRLGLIGHLPFSRIGLFSLGPRELSAASDDQFVGRVRESLDSDWGIFESSSRELSLEVSMIRCWTDEVECADDLILLLAEREASNGAVSNGSPVNPRRPSSA
jgi:hypothetical protein